MPSPKTGSTYVALMRGINVGGKNLLPMKDLVKMFLAAGCTEARTYIQSGNVIFRASPSVAARIPAKIRKAVSDRFGFEGPVTVRTAAELRRVAKSNPFLRAGTEAATLHVAFLADLPASEAVAGLDRGRSPPDRFEARGREIYLDCPSGMARTKLTNQYFDSKLSTTCTVRNWRTVLALLELAEA
jgi:uncharacterized protein (DUF1697 family)